MLKILFLLFTTILLITLQLAVLPAIHPSLIYFINLPLVFFVLVIFFYDFELALSNVFLLGLFLDLYSPLFFGFHILIFIIIFLISKIALSHILQHKNWIALLVINLFSLLIWHLLYILINFIIHQLIFTPQLILSLIYQFIIHSLVILSWYKFSSRLRFKLDSQIIH